MSDQRIVFLLDRHLAGALLPAEKDELSVLASSGLYDRQIQEIIGADILTFAPEKTLGEASSDRKSVV